MVPNICTERLKWLVFLAVDRIKMVLVFKFSVAHPYSKVREEPPPRAKPPIRHCEAKSSVNKQNFINVRVTVFTLWPSYQRGTPAKPLTRPPYHQTDKFSKSDNNTLGQILAEGKNGSLAIGVIAPEYS